ncbi:MAG TPA: hypothetical protein VMD28_02060 [Acidimicrobiales bacterium]|nr:hypothetical protein [Acidimicrobiales bacterium]
MPVDLFLSLDAAAGSGFLSFDAAAGSGLHTGVLSSLPPVAVLLVLVAGGVARSECRRRRVAPALSRFLPPG